MPASRLRRVHVEGVLDTSTNTGVAPNQATTSAVAAKVKDGHEHRIAGLTPIAISASPARRCRWRSDSTCLAPQNVGELLLELGDLRAHDVLAVVDDAQDRVVHALADPAALRAEIDELDRLAGLAPESGMLRSPRACRVRSRGSVAPCAGRSRSGPRLLAGTGSSSRCAAPATPTISAKAGTSCVTTAPAAMKQYSPSVCAAHDRRVGADRRAPSSPASAGIRSCARSRRAG